uniref:PolyA polymerase n=1 Tax=Rhizophora mucronata TaxID=61149 RepID=A0A2P2KV41_RHIMU
MLLSALFLLLMATHPRLLQQQIALFRLQIFARLLHQLKRLLPKISCKFTGHQ